MGLSVEFKRTDNYLQAKIMGKWQTDDALKAIEEVKKEAEIQDVKHILFDLQDLSNPDTEMTRFFSGVKIAKEFNHSYKIAGYSQMEKINRFAETVAVNRGINFRMFTTEADAVKWLLG